MLRQWANSVVRIETEKRRLEILEYLMGTPGYEAAASLLRLNCQRLGVPSTMDQTIAALQWLEEQELITVRRHADEIIARITLDGREVADGTRTVPGVMRPDP
ncbi:hypothetical protein [Loktanella sp. DSM 29012]|uniref:VpaChn25_0724 family phage protein n=1 Tax=Loktanella sp. DSM 29012 TaxID=1881056 RepID=UPI000B7F3FE4|nr:hypothetical protein [Loktanella sp. DSM 29012]